MNEKEAYAKLGLDDPDWFASCAALGDFGPDPRRRDGKTTRMLVNAALHLQRDVTVVIKGHTKRFTAECRWRTAEIVKQLGFYARGRILGEGLSFQRLGQYSDIFVDRRPFGGLVLFEDHAPYPRYSGR